MTPELKAACEVVFQEHKTSRHPVTWNRDAFRGRISTGLTDMAKETLISKNIIQFPNPSKKIITVLNPAVAAASTYEEAEDLVLNKVPSMATAAATNEQPGYTPGRRSVFVTRTVTHHPVVTHAASDKTEGILALPQAPKWYMKPVFVYGIWPVCAAVVGGLIAYLMGFVYTEMVFDLKK